MKHPLIIGAGGVASYLLPCLLRAFKPERVTLVDKDILEERNLDRQMFREDQVGQPKIRALVDFVDSNQNSPVHYTFIEDWFTQNTIIPDDIDAIICVADNHEARRNAIQRAYDLQIRCYIGGNEYFDAEAYMTEADDADTKLDPRVRYPDIRTSNEGSPMRCTGEAQEIHPQLAIANFRCAGHIMHLIHVWEVYFAGLELKDRMEIKNLLPIELCSSLYDQTTNTKSTWLTHQK